MNQDAKQTFYVSTCISFLVFGLTCQMGKLSRIPTWPFQWIDLHQIRVRKYVQTNAKKTEQFKLQITLASFHV